MAFLSYGTYQFPPDAVSFTIQSRPIINPIGVPNYLDVRWYLDGRVNGNNTDEVVAAVEELEAALVPGQNLFFSIYHSLLSSNCVQGTQIYDFKWLRGRDNTYGSGAELVLRRTFRAVIGGKVLVTSGSDLVSYSESIRGIGTGGPVVKPVRSLVGGVQAQQTTAITEYYARQSGIAVALTNWPAASTPIWQTTPNVYYMPEQCYLEEDTPKLLGINGNTQFTTRWGYFCWAPFQLVASPIPPF